MLKERAMSWLDNSTTHCASESVPWGASVKKSECLQHAGPVGYTRGLSDRSERRRATWPINYLSVWNRVHRRLFPPNRG